MQERGQHARQSVVQLLNILQLVLPADVALRVRLHADLFGAATLPLAVVLGVMVQLRARLATHRLAEAGVHVRRRYAAERITRGCTRLSGVAVAHDGSKHTR